MQVRMASGALALAAGLSLTACEGDEPSTSASPAPSASVPTVRIDRALFSPAVIQDAVKLDCLGDRSTVTDIDREGPDAKPLRSPDPATDGLAALGHANRTRYEIEDGKSPTPRYLFPKSPPAAREAIIQFVSPSGRVVAAFIASRAVARGPWRATTVMECE